MLPILFAVALFFQCYAVVDAAIPRSKSDAAAGTGMSSMEQEALSSLLLSEEPAAEPSMIGVAGDDDDPSAAAAIVLGRGSGGGQRVIVMLADAAMLRSLRALNWGLSHYKHQQQQRAGEGGSSLLLDHRGEQQQQQQGPGLGLGLGLLKRDTMRCMVGRVYRPCWEA